MNGISDTETRSLQPAVCAVCLCSHSVGWPLTGQSDHQPHEIVRNGVDCGLAAFSAVISVSSLTDRMLSPEEANNLVLTYLGEGLRARHSVFVGHLMAHFARMLGEDQPLWEVTGLCHDLDFEDTADDRSRHGLLAAEWLENDLPNVALLAIQSYDHRTGITSNTTLALALKLADAVAVGELDVGRDAMVEALGAASSLDRLGRDFVGRPVSSKVDHPTSCRAFDSVGRCCIYMPDRASTMTASAKR